MNIAAVWDQLVDAVCRPPRDVYDEDDLVGGRRAAFAYGESRDRIKKYYRQDVELVNPRGQRLQCSHYRPCVVTSKDGRLPAVIYCHTNSGSRRDAEEILFTLLPKGITVFALDFAGSGLSDGQWVTLGAHEVEDLEAAVNYLRDEGSTSTLGLWGRSMGAVTALLYSKRDPSIAAVVADSPFSRLVDLMLELATSGDGGLSIPRPLVKVALGMMKRSVRRRTGFSIDNVAPLDAAPSMFVPALFGHAAGDTFVAPHHSERLFVAHGADTKNFIAFEGDHNGMRPDFWYDSALIFLLGALRVEDLVGPDLDLHAIDPEEAPHMSGRGIYVAGCRGELDATATDACLDLENDGRSATEPLDTTSRGQLGRDRMLPAPWNLTQAHSRIGPLEAGLDVGRAASLHRAAAATLGGGTHPHGLAGTDVDGDVVAPRDSSADEDEEACRREEDLLQQVLEMSMADLGTSNGYDEDWALAQAIEASLKEASAVKSDCSLKDTSELSEVKDIKSTKIEGKQVAEGDSNLKLEESHNRREVYQSRVKAHSEAEAQAVAAPAAAVRHMMLEAATSFCAATERVGEEGFEEGVIPADGHAAGKGEANNVTATE